MIANNDKIINTQLYALLGSTVIGTGILSLPAILAQGVKTNGWIVILINGFLAVIITAIISLVSTKFKGDTLFEIGNRLVTKPVSYIISGIFAIYFIILSAFEVRVFGEVIKMFLLTNTPIEVIIISMLLATAYLSRSGIEAIARLALLLFPLTLLPIVLLFVALTPNLDLTNLLPVFDVGFMDIIKAIPGTFFSFVGFEFLFIYMAFIDTPSKSIRYNIASIVSVTIIYIIVYLVVISQLGTKETIHQLWPTLSLMITIKLPGAFIENVQGVVMSIWVLIVLTSLAPAMYAGSLLTSKICSAKSYNYFVLAFIPIIYIISLVPDNLAALYEYMDLFTYYLGTFCAVVVPIVFFMVALIKKKEKGGIQSNG